MTFIFVTFIKMKIYLNLYFNCKLYNIIFNQVTNNVFVQTWDIAFLYKWNLIMIVILLTNAGKLIFFFCVHKYIFYSCKKA